MAASSPIPREITPPAYGVRAFILSKQQFINAGDLVDVMMQDADIRRTGAFIGKLEASARPSHQDIVDNVQIVMDTVRRDSINPDTGRPYFDPTLQLRGDIWPEKNVFQMVPASNKDTDTRSVKKLRREFKKNFLNHDFLDRREEQQSDLERIYHASGVNGVLDTFFASVVQQQKKILYAVNIVLEKDLRVTKDLALNEMRSFMDHLPGDPCPGINRSAVFIGQEGSTFNPHIEDCAFQAVNYHIAGAPKLWFIIPPRFYTAFTNLIKRLGIPKAERCCDYLLNHNNMFLDPRTVIQYGIPVFTVVQQPGDTVYLLPHVIHWGINLGYNINETINIASRSWAMSGMIAPGRCCCISVDDDFEGFDITPILRKINIDDETIAKYEAGRVADIMSVCDTIHPDNGAPFTTTIKLENLLGENFKDTEVGKRFNIADVVPDQANGTKLWGGYDDVVIDVSDEEDSDKEEKTTSKRKLICPKSACGRTYEGGVVKRLRQHVDKVHADDPAIEEFRRKLDEWFPPRNKTNRMECPECGKMLAGGLTHIRLHQKSSACVRQQLQ